MHRGRHEGHMTLDDRLGLRQIQRCGISNHWIYPVRGCDPDGAESNPAVPLVRPATVRYFDLERR
jgi:hypothetical protein